MGRLISLPRRADDKDVGCVSPGWIRVLDSWGNALRAAGRAPQTVDLRCYHVRRFASWTSATGPEQVTVDDLLGWLGGQSWSRATRASYRASLRAFFSWAVVTGRCGTNPAHGIPAPAASPPAPRPAREPDYRLALAKADPRVRLMVRLAGDLGLRRAEVARVHTDDVVRDLLGWSLVVRGKGDRTRMLPLSEHLARELLAAPAGWVFPGADEGHLSPRWVGKLVGRVLPTGTSMHALRHRFATQAYAVDRDLLTVQQLLGHASPVTTRAYVRTDEDAKRRTVAAVASTVA